MNKFLSIQLLSVMLAYNVKVQENDDNTVTISDPVEEGEETTWDPITVPRSIYKCCNLIASDEAWDTSHELNESEDVEDQSFGFDERVDRELDEQPKHDLSDREVENVVNSQYDPM